MSTSLDVRKKWVLLLCNVIGNCVHKARMVPYILKQEEIINLLIEDPALFTQLIQEEQAVDNWDSKGNITANFDALDELQRIKAIDSFSDNYRHLSLAEIDSFLDLINEMTHIFGIFIGNASILLDKRMDEFIGNYREFLSSQAMDVRRIDFTVEETVMLEKSAIAYIDNGEFLQAFTFARLLNEQGAIREMIRFPPLPMSLYEVLIRHTLNKTDKASDLIHFILHASYLSQGDWNDLFQILTRTILNKPGEYDRLKYIEAIERNIVFCCNLLYKSIMELRDISPTKIRTSILQSLDKFRD